MSAADEPRHPHTPTPRERSPLVDRLLMSGLDEYFAGRYERAIQVWSRVFFIDRGHARARAYIDRARTAMAESQREAEACGGAPDAELEVRSLIGTIGPEPARSSAPDSRPPIHGALAAMPRRAEAMTRPPTPPVVPVRRGAKRGRVAHALLVLAAGVLLFGAGYTVAARDRLARWWQASGDGPRSSLTGTLGVGSSEDVLGRVRQLLDRGLFDEALKTLSTIAADDPRWPEANVLREKVRQAVATGAVPAAPRPVLGRSGFESR